MADFNSTYGLHPWAGIVDNTRDIYIPDLLDTYRRRSIYQGLIPYKVDLGARNATVMTFTTMYDLLPDTTELGLREMWVEPFITDSEQKSISLTRYGGKVALHDWDEMINQWRKNGVSGLRDINRGLLANQMTDTLDLLARNSLMSGTFHLFGAGGAKANIGALAGDGTDDFDPADARDIWLGAMTRGRQGAVDASTGVGEGGTIMALTTPSVIMNISQDEKFIHAAQYAKPELLMTGEVGTYLGVRYINAGPDHILWNTGALSFQGAVTAAIRPGAGAARNVDANRVTGQASIPYSGNRFIQIGATNLATGNTLVPGTPGAGEENLSGTIKVNDIVTIHILRTNAFGVTNGVDYRDPTTVNARVVAVDNATRQIALDRPVLRDFNDDLGGGVFAYVSKGLSVHPTVFMTGPAPVVAGVAIPPTFHTPTPVDDFERYYRFSWDSYMKYQIWNDHNVEVMFNTGQYRVKGNARR